MKKYLCGLLIAQLLLPMVTSHAMEESSAQLTTCTQDSVRKLPQELQRHIALVVKLRNLRNAMDELQKHIAAAVEQRNRRNAMDSLPREAQRGRSHQQPPCNLHMHLVKTLCCVPTQKLRAIIHDAAYSPSGKLLAVAGTEPEESHAGSGYFLNRRFIRYYKTQNMELVHNNSIGGKKLKGITFNPEGDSTVLLSGTDSLYGNRGYDNNDYFKLEEIGQHKLFSSGRCLIGGLHESDSRLIAWYPDGRGFIYEDLLWKLQHVDLHADPTGKPLFSIDMPGPIEALDTQQTPKALVTDQYTRKATIRDATTGHILSTLQCKDNAMWINAARFCDKGRKVVIAPLIGELYKYEDGSTRVVFKLKIYDTCTGKKTASFETKGRIDQIAAVPQSPIFITSEENPSDRDPTDPITVWMIKEEGTERLFTFPVTALSLPKVLSIDAQQNRLFVAQATQDRGFSIFSIPALWRMHRQFSRLTASQQELLEKFDKAIQTESSIKANLREMPKSFQNALDKAIQTESSIKANQRQWNAFREMPKSFQNALVRYIRPQPDVIDIIKRSKKEEGFLLVVKKLIEYAHLTAIQDEKEHIDRTFRKEKLLEAFERAVTMPGTIHASQEQWDIFEKLSADFQQIMLGYITKKAEAEDRMVEKQ